MRNDTGHRANTFRNKIRKRSSWNIILIYNLITVSIIAAFYPLIPSLLNYPPNNEEVSASLGTSNISQYITITGITVILGTLILLWFFRGIDKWHTLDPDDPQNADKIFNIRIKCLNLPSFIFLLQILIMMIPLSILLFTVATINRITYLAPAKIILMVTSFFTLAAVITHTFAKESFKNILIQTYSNQEQEGLKLSLSKKIFLQVLPLLIIAILYTSLIGYSRLINEKGDLIYAIINAQLHESAAGTAQISNFDDAFRTLQSVRLENMDFYYIAKSPEGIIKTSNGSALGGYLTYFIDHPYKSDRLYDINSEIQGVIREVQTDSGIWKVGIVFHVVSTSAVEFFVIGFLIILILSIFVLYYFSKSLSRDISQVAEKLVDIAEGEYADFNRKIPVTSNDEIGDLVVAFNKVLKREKEHLEYIEAKHEFKMEQERLASLGQLMSGIAHNMRTPIMSLSGGIEGLRDLVKEAEASIGDPDVTKEDHHEISSEMIAWIEKMKIHCSYMSDIITAIRGQAMQASNDRYLSFTLDEIGKRIQVLLSHELKKHRCTLQIDLSAGYGARIRGDLSVMVQILSNLILNAAEAYDGKGGFIRVKALLDQGKVLLTVSDQAMGISNIVKDKLFNEMVTTKGKNGTGLGLYMSSSNVKERLGGKMWFESETNCGTTFFIHVPILGTDTRHNGDSRS